MTEESSGVTKSGEGGKIDSLPTGPRRRQWFPLPGLAAIAFYMFALAAMTVIGVVGGKFPPAFLIFSVAFIAAALGLLMLFRWAWALTLGAVALLVALFGWKFAVAREAPFIVQGLLNLVFFLYLVRTEVRSKLR